VVGGMTEQNMTSAVDALQ